MNLFKTLLPRHLELIYELNARFLEQVRTKFPGDTDRVARMSLIDESGDKYVRMANLSCLGSHTINGVADLHSQLIKETVLRDFYEFAPHKFTNVTNGVTPRRWIVLSNQRLSNLISEKIGDNWIKYLDDLKQLEDYADDPEFQARWRQIKQAVKQDLAARIKDLGIVVDPRSLFDVQVKRIHEYKRQHLNVLHIITLYNRLKQNPDLEITPRTFIFAGKAAPSYHMAKLIIKLITAVGDVVNADPDVRDRLKVVFMPDYNVTNSQRIYPAADLSEQISTAGKEASGTGNMKFALNGALTIGTLDGANVEIRQQVGAENFFLFGLTEKAVEELKPHYNPWDYYSANAELQSAIDAIRSGTFSPGNPDLFKPLTDQLLYQDPFMLLADYQSYIDCQERVGQAYQDQDQWTRMSILNVARMGKFSSDRSIREYAQNIWQVEPVPVQLEDYIHSPERDRLQLRLHETVLDGK